MIRIGRLLSRIVLACVIGSPLVAQQHPFMHFTHEQMKAHEITRDKRQSLHIDTTAQSLATLGNLSLLSYFPHDAQTWNQGGCGDCWVWGCTAVASISNGVHGYPGPFSVQYLNSNFVRAGGSSWACCGGWADDFVSFYNGSKFFIQWSNQNAYFQDQFGVCGGTTAQNGSGISTTPNDPFTGISLFRVPTYAFWTSRASAISAIKSVLNQKRAIAFTFFLSQNGWNAFNTWWNSIGENAVWGDFNSARGDYAGHLVALVGYDDSDSSWILKNSWGTTSGRPNGTFKIPQSLAYAPPESVGSPLLEFDCLDIAWYNTTVVITNPSTDLTINSGTLINFTGVCTNGGPGQPLNYSWDFGDGTTTGQMSTNLSSTTSHAFINHNPYPMTYNVILKVSNPFPGWTPTGIGARKITVAP